MSMTDHINAAVREQQRYNGWTNYETWCVHLWLSNDGDTYGRWSSAAQEAWDDAEADGVFSRSENARFALADTIKADVEDGVPDDLSGTMYGDLLTAAISETDWSEIADAFLSNTEDENDEDGYESDD